MFGKNSRSSYRLKPQNPVETVDDLHNPGCGWYQMYKLRVEERPDPVALSYCMRGTLVQLFIRIGAYRDKPLDEEALSHIREAFELLKDAKKDVILRIAYDDEGKGLESEPDMFAKVLAHVDQLMPVLQQYADCIQVFQGLYIGSWGEMHSSKFLTKPQLTQLFDKTRACLGEQVPIVFRRPMYCRRLSKEDEIRKGMGIFDDGLFGSEINLGTFGTESRKYMGWESPWNREEETAYIQRLCEYAPNGGESVWGDYKYYPHTLEKTVSMLSELRISYLNYNYHPDILAEWERMTWEGRGSWKGMDGKSYIGRHLGYRFRITQIRQKHPDSRQDAVVEAGNLYLQIQIVNDGFAHCCEPIECMVQLRPRGSTDPAEYEEYSTSGGLQHLAPGGRMELTARLPFHPGQLYLGMRRVKDGAAVRFANKSEGRWVPLGQITYKGGKSAWR